LAQGPKAHGSSTVAFHFAEIPAGPAQRAGHRQRATG
jgi:hypothetical protein